MLRCLKNEKKKISSDMLVGNKISNRFYSTDLQKSLMRRTVRNGAG